VPVPGRATETEFRKSSFSGGGDCLEVGFAAGGHVYVRNSRERTSGELRFTVRQWGTFLAGVRKGDFTE
jgi:hypothetical protein